MISTRLSSRFYLPILIMLIAIVTSCTWYITAYYSIQSTTKKAVISQLQNNLFTTQALLEQLEINDQFHKSTIQSIISAQSAQPDIALSLVSDEANKILASSKLEYRSMLWHQYPLVIHKQPVIAVINQRSTYIHHDQKNHLLHGYISICRNRDNQYPASNCGFFLQQIKLDHHLTLATHTLNLHSTYTCIIITLLILITMFFVDNRFGKRLTLLASRITTLNSQSATKSPPSQELITYMLKQIQQVTEQITQHEISLFNEKRLISSLYELNDNAILIINTQNHIIYANNAAASIFRYTPTTLNQLNIENLLPHIPRVNHCQSPANPELPSQIDQYEFEGIRCDGERFAAEIRICELHADTKTETLLQIKDISAVKQLQLKQHQQKQAYQESMNFVTSELFAILNTTIIGIITVNQQRAIIRINPAAEQLFGWQANQIQGAPINRLIPQLAEQAFDTTAKHQTSPNLTIAESPIELIAKHKNDSQFPAQLHIGHYHLADNTNISVIFITDITAQQQRQQQLILDKEKAELTAQTKTNFLANMGHEIRTPINAILGFSELLAQETEPHTKNHEFAHTILDSGRNLLRIIDDILDFTKIEAGKIKLETLSFNLISSVTNAIKLFEVSAANKQLSIHLEIENNIPEVVIGDPTRLRQILTNLVGNAIKFTHEGSITIKLNKVAASQLIQFSIIDTGIGMSVKQRNKVFEPFSQAEISTNRRFGGSGLGTTICKEMVELMEGRIWVESIQGRGSTFYFTVKLPDVNTLPRKSELSQSLDGKLPLTTLKILLAESIASNAQLITLELLKKGHDITWVTNEQQVVNKATNETFDLILMDISLPQLDGFSATKQIREFEALRHSSHYIPIIALVDVNHQLEHEVKQTHGIDKMIHKPIDFTMLLAAINEIITPKN